MKSLLQVVLEFAHMLRQWGIAVGPEQVEDALHALTVTGIHQREIVRNVLKMTMVAKRWEEEVFDMLFELHFMGMEFPPLLRATGDTSPALAFILFGDERKFLEILEQLVNAETPQGDQRMFGAFLWRVLTASGLASARDELRAFLNRLLEEGSISREEFEKLLEEGNTRISKLREKLRPLIEKMLVEKGVMRDRRVNSLVEREFYSLSDEELNELRLLCRHLGRQLRTVLSAARKHSRKGDLDVRRMLRESEGTDGVPFKLIYRQRRIKKPRLVILADVSSSMRHSLEFFLRILHAVREEFSSVRLFIFVNSCMEVSWIPWDRNPLDTLGHLAEKEGFDLYAYTNYGASLQSFMENYASALTRRTSVIFIGDGRSNYADPGEEVMKRMREIVRHIYWLNPEPVYGWVTGDSEMKTFIKYVDGAYVVRSLQDMWNFVRDLVLGRGQTNVTFPEALALKG